MAQGRLIFGRPPFSLLIRHLIKDDNFKADARTILELDHDAYLHLATQLEKRDAFLDRTELTTLANQAIGEGKKASDIVSIIYRLSKVLHDADMPVTEAMKELGETIDEEENVFKAEERQTLVNRIRTLAAKPIGLAKQHKARKLVDATGSELDDVQIICDIRPIFDHDREQIDGAIPLSILRLEYTKSDEESAVVEVRITEKQIEKLQSSLDTAKRKLGLIKKLLKDQSVSIPATKATVTEEEQ